MVDPPLRMTTNLCGGSISVMLHVSDQGSLLHIRSVVSRRILRVREEVEVHAGDIVGEIQTQTARDPK